MRILEIAVLLRICVDVEKYWNHDGATFQSHGNNRPRDAEPLALARELNARKQNNLENYGGTLAGGLSSLSVPAKFNFKGRRSRLKAAAPPSPPFATNSSRRFLRDPVIFADDVSGLMLEKELLDLVEESIYRTGKATPPLSMNQKGLGRFITRNVSFLWSRPIRPDEE